MDGGKKDEEKGREKEKKTQATTGNQAPFNSGLCARSPGPLVQSVRVLSPPAELTTYGKVQFPRSAGCES